MWDNAYCVHHLTDTPDTLLNLYNEAVAVGNEDMVIQFTSTSKISFPGAGVAALAASPRNVADIKARMTIQTIGHDKINMLRKAANEYMDESLRQTEEAISKALAEVRDTRMKFRSVTEAQEQRRMANVDIEV